MESPLARGRASERWYWLHPTVTMETMRKWQQIRSVLTEKVGIFEDVQLLVELFRREVELSGLSLQRAQLLAGLRAAVLDAGEVSFQVVQGVGGLANLCPAECKYISLL